MGGRALILAGLLLVAAGLLWNAGLLSWLGKLPGDIAIKKDNASFYFPLTTCLVLSAGLSLLLWLLRR